MQRVVNHLSSRFSCWRCLYSTDIRSELLRHRSILLHLIIEMIVQREVLLHLPEDLFLEGVLLFEQLVSELDIAMVAITELEGVGGTGLVILPGTVVGDQSLGCEFLVHD